MILALAYLVFVCFFLTVIIGMTAYKKDWVVTRVFGCGVILIQCFVMIIALVTLPQVTERVFVWLIATLLTISVAFVARAFVA